MSEVATKVGTAARDVADRYSGEDDVPVGSYAAVVGTYLAGVTAAAVAAKAMGRSLPSRIGAGDVLLLGIATHKGTRLLGKGKVTSFLRAPFTRYQRAATAAEVNEAPRGRGVGRAVGELVTCPFCLGMWVGTGLVAGSVLAPRATRLAASTLAVVSISDWLQFAWSLTQQATED
ncbi:MAG TPA: DUF1360 domain-containing protein [Cryptosporangiaceae bacterium]|nr:DUF1360 domain-containing protein [Cryptosporangiaceae bacterium]